jgi:Nuclear transport factor 2 (NTF2) domain
MSHAPTAELLAAVEESPRAAAAHDRAGWVGLFTDDGRVEDPVGSRAHVGAVRIGRFYDTFIGPRQITFHRDLDIVSGTSVIRDLTLEVMMSADVRMMIPAFLRYDLRQSEGGWQIERLRAYWELPTMVMQFARHGAKSLPASLRLSAGLLRNQRLGGTAGFLLGFRGHRRRGKRLVEHALADGRLGDARNRHWHKVIAAGDTVVASVMTPAGRGVLFAHLDHRSREIRDVKLFREAAPTDPA